MTKLELTSTPARLLWIRYVHQLSGALLAFFILLHLGNHLLAFFGGVNLHREAMLVLRKLYRFPPFEGLLLIAVGVQLVTGIRLVLAKWRYSTGMERWQAASGLYLCFFLLVHLYAIMMARFSWHIETDFHFAAAGLRRFPYLFFFVPYYFFAVFAAFLHIACIPRLHAKATAIIVAGALTATLIVISLMGISCNFAG